MMGVTPMQAKALAAIGVLTRDGVSPSYNEIRQELGLASNAGVHRLLLGLKERGLVDFLPYRARTVRIVGDIDGLERRSTADLIALRLRVTEILRGRAQ